MDIMEYKYVKSGLMLKLYKPSNSECKSCVSMKVSSHSGNTRSVLFGRKRKLKEQMIRNR